MTRRWEVEYTDQFGTWWESLTAGQQVAVAQRVEYLAVEGPNAKRPAVGEVGGSKIKNLKELRASTEGGQLRVLFVFDPRQTAILLLGGDKAKDSLFKRWYPEAIAEAEALYTAYLDDLRADGLI